MSVVKLPEYAWAGLPNASVTAPAANRVRPPFVTYANTDARFAQAASGGQFAIWAQGRDVSGGYDEKGVVYEPGVLGGDGRIVSHDISVCVWIR